MLKEFFKIAHQRQTKEIGVRKVAGSSVKNIATSVSKGFLKLVVIFMVIASPVEWYATGK
ncbi:hypothetical protein FW778_21500 [Ginsengibacter hankyongi]|uniref:Uncharacterized protein n=1 Tax=Ginsengibacter hankyongi TaxID=2607284 RepID=A0A5J5IEE2_9BACT|nr:hypothetical protein [Ginsengibacter hankyongi]KAA9035535.1 hypothetical protein FW778_21500 [Ginsengibacter hankyongi]